MNNQTKKEQQKTTKNAAVEAREIYMELSIYSHLLEKMVESRNKTLENIKK